jgi:hypothetical protein
MHRRLRLLSCFAILATLLLADAALAIEPGPPATPRVGELELLRDRRAGFFEEVRKSSAEVSWVRDGSERAALPGLALHQGDAIRTADGVCAVAGDGLRIEVGPRSQLRFDEVVLQRFGDVTYEAVGAVTVDLGAIRLEASAARVAVHRAIAGEGEVVVLSGSARLVGPGGAVQIEAGGSSTFTQEAIEPPQPLGQAELEALDVERERLFGERESATPARRDRVIVRLEGGVSWFDQLRGWGRGGLELRVRPAGPLWLVLGASATGRGVDETVEAETAWALPTHLGFRLMADLPASFFIAGGADFQLLVATWYAGDAAGSSDVTVQPGGRLAISGGMFLSRHFGFDLEFSGGVLRKVLPAPSATTTATVVVDPQFHLSIGIFARF